jgi:predicted RNase H-like nuclease
MGTILGIDPAWTDHQPSGVALLEAEGQAWRCVGLAPGYGLFVALSEGRPVDWSEKPLGGAPDVDALLNAARELLGGLPVDVVTIDMPVATREITGRRAADSAISRTYGGRGCSTHSPNSARPGEIGHSLTEAFRRRGYPVATTTTSVGSTPVLVEVYPHTALLALLGVEYRVPYKVSRAERYWPGIPPLERRAALVETWERILNSLSVAISGIDLPWPTGSALESVGPSKLKRYEDTLDALICAWIGLEYSAGRCQAFGDSEAAIWTP